MKENALVDVIKEGLKVAFFVNKRSKDMLFFFFKKRKLKGRGYKKVLLKKRGSSAFIKSHIRGYKLYKRVLSTVWPLYKPTVSKEKSLFCKSSGDSH